MLGISGSEFLVILLVAIAVVPSRHWPRVARLAAATLRRMRDAVGKIQDAADELEDRVAAEAPIDALTRKTMDDMIGTFSSPLDPGGGKK